jgi:trans-2,3-dihydro-3-hydroxyanthranilate isomerase
VNTLPYEIVDVFTDRPFTGAPLAVVFDAEGLTDEQMQALAREFNLSETVFVLPPVAAEASYRLRIFTPDEELPFAGHPSVGAAVMVVRRGLLPPGPLLQECGVGLLPIQVYPEGSCDLDRGYAHGERTGGSAAAVGHGGIDVSRLRRAAAPASWLRVGVSLLVSGAGSSVSRGGRSGRRPSERDSSSKRGCLGCQGARSAHPHVPSNRKSA